jgi:predicted Zn finger-like uncharacterized protein
MRLICPNCGAQYAVAEDAIPSGGRDVQCSNCAHTWFETPGASASDTPTEPRKPTPPPTPPPTPTPNADRFSGSINDAFKDVEDEENLSPAPQPPKNRKPVDPSVADILRQEAAIETTRRKTETASTMESQSDLGLSDPAPVRPKAPEQPAPATVAAVVSAPIASIATTAQAPRRELLPDIEEINSSLRSDAERIEDGTAGPEAAANAKRKDFQSGFITVLLLIGPPVLIYTQADKIVDAIPALANTIKAYVDAIDIGRIWLDDNVQSMLSYIAAE